MNLLPSVFEGMIASSTVPTKDRRGKQYTQAHKIIYPPDTNVMYLEEIYDDAQLWLPFNSFIVLTSHPLNHSNLYVDGSTTAYRDAWKKHNRKGKKAQDRRPSADNNTFRNSQKKYKQKLSVVYNSLQFLDDFEQLTLPFQNMRRMISNFDLTGFVEDPNGRYEIIKFKVHERGLLTWLDTNCVGRYYVFDTYGYNHAIFFENSDDASWFKLENSIKAMAEIKRYSVEK